MLDLNHLDPVGIALTAMLAVLVLVGVGALMARVWPFHRQTSHVEIITERPDLQRLPADTLVKAAALVARMEPAAIAVLDTYLHPSMNLGAPAAELAAELQAKLDREDSAKEIGQWIFNRAGYAPVHALFSRMGPTASVEAGEVFGTRSSALYVALRVLGLVALGVRGGALALEVGVVAEGVRGPIGPLSGPILPAA